MKDDNGKVILALLAGASAGLVAGILMAPETGEATRGNLKKSASKLGTDLGSTLQAGKEQLQALGSSAGSLLGRVTGGGDAPVVNTGSNTTPTSHLSDNSTGGNVSAATGSATEDVAGGPVSITSVDTTTGSENSSSEAKKTRAKGGRKSAADTGATSETANPTT